MSELIAAVIVPPYCGVPRLSHQFPVEVVDAVVVTVALDVVEVEAIVEVLVVVITGVVVVVVGIVVELVVVDEEQDANTSDVTIRMISAIQVTPLFI
jgi:hypothetical protein